MLKDGFNTSDWNHFDMPVPQQSGGHESGPMALMFFRQIFSERDVMDVTPAASDPFRLQIASDLLETTDFGEQFKSTPTIPDILERWIQYRDHLSAVLPELNMMTNKEQCLVSSRKLLQQKRNGLSIHFSQSSRSQWLRSHISSIIEDLD
jgi:hypothetical protein